MNRFEKRMLEVGKPLDPQPPSRSGQVVLFKDLLPGEMWRSHNTHFLDEPQIFIRLGKELDEPEWTSIIAPNGNKGRGFSLRHDRILGPTYKTWCAYNHKVVII